MAVDTRTKEPVISLDACWHDRPVALRARAEGLECSFCHGPVMARAGEQNRWHFAHKNANDCPLSHTDPARMLGRARLFEWLAAKEGLRNRLSIEEVVKVDNKVHQVDCVITDEKKDVRFAYLFYAAGVREREALFEALRLKYKYHYPVFHSQTVKPAGESYPNGIKLSTTHRDAINIYGETGYYFDSEMPLLAGRSLHVLDPDSATLWTYREVRCRQPPQVFSGDEIASPLKEVQISPKTGELLHPSEDSVFQLRKRKRRQEEAARKAAEERAKRRRRF